MRPILGCLLLAGAIAIGVPGVLLMRCARWFGRRMREVEA